MKERIPVETGDRIQVRKTSNGWDFTLHTKDGGFVGRAVTDVKSFDEAISQIKVDYNVD